MNLFLHIGTRKTGSSLIQNFCQFNKDKLLEQGYFYPDNNDLGERRGKSPGHWRLHKIFEGRDNFTLDSYLSSPLPAENVILSNEALTSEHCDFLAMPEKVWNLLADTFHVTVIIYLRRQDLYLCSLYNEWVVSGNHKSVLSFDQFIEQNKFPELDYYSLIHSWSDVFGRENLRIRPFENGQFFQGDLIKDFLNCVGLCYNENYIVPDTIFKNVSPDAILVEAVRLINRVPLQLRPMYKSFLDNAFEDTVLCAKYCAEKKRSLISPARRSAILAQYSSSNAQVARDFLSRADGRLFHEPVPDEEEPWTPVSIDDPDLVARVFSLFLEQKSVEIHERFAEQDTRIAGQQSRLDAVGKEAAALKRQGIACEKQGIACEKRLATQQFQLDSGRKTQEVHKQELVTLRNNVWHAIKGQGRSLSKNQQEIQRARNHLHRLVLSIYRRARSNPWNRLCRFLRSPLRSELKLLRTSGLVDPHYYFENYPQTISAGLTAVEHYFRYGAQQGLNPSANFNTQQYLAEYLDVAHAGINPLVHFILHKRGITA